MDTSYLHRAVWVPDPIDGWKPGFLASDIEKDRPLSEQATLAVVMEGTNEIRHIPVDNTAVAEENSPSTPVGKRRRANSKTASMRSCRGELACGSFRAAKQAGVCEYLPLRNKIGPSGVGDMCSLEYLHEPAVLENLHIRHMRHLVYTNAGPVCVATNPFKWIDIYSKAKMEQYARNGEMSDLPPHLYTISARAFTEMVETGQNQSILVNGRSGAGKTESVRLLMDHIAYLSRKHSGIASESTSGNAPAQNLTGPESDVVAKILSSSSVLQAFGNAQTLLNDNSSRFGKFLKLAFQEGQVIGATCDTYLLEKSRVVNCQPHESNFHIFYQLCNAPLPLRQRLGLAKDLNLCDYLPNFFGQEDKDVRHVEFPDTDTRLSILGLLKEEKDAIYRLLAAIILIGELRFVSNNVEGDEAKISGPSLSKVCQLLSLPETDLEEALCFRSINFLREKYQSPLHRHAAAIRRDVLAKTIYSRLFDWLIDRVNESLRLPVNRNASSVKWIGILDIFGFESFETNGLEQLCINYTNEKLHQLFTQEMILDVIQDYRGEGVLLDVETWNYKDNSDTISLIGGPLGLIDLLNEEVIRPSGSDKAFLGKLFHHQAHAAELLRVRAYPNRFVITHFSGEVIYTVDGFVDKNRDAIPAELEHVLMETTDVIVYLVLQPSDEEPRLSNSSNGSGDTSRSDEELHADSSNRQGKGRSLIHNLSPPSPARRAISMEARKSSGVLFKHRHRASNTVCAKFTSQLDALLDAVKSTQIQHVKCIKPNTSKSPYMFNRSFVLHQLRNAGLLDAIHVTRLLYPCRVPLEAFLERYSRLLRVSQRLLGHTGRNGIVTDASDDKLSPPLSSREKTIFLLEQLSFEESKDFSVGKTKLFCKKDVISRLERLIRVCFRHQATYIQGWWRASLQWRQHEKLKNASATKIQATWKSKRSLRRRQVLLTSIRSIQSFLRLSYRKKMTLRRSRLESLMVKRIAYWWLNCARKRSNLQQHISSGRKAAIETRVEEKSSFLQKANLSPGNLPRPLFADIQESTRRDSKTVNESPFLEDSSGSLSVDIDTTGRYERSGSSAPLCLLPILTVKTPKQPPRDAKPPEDDADSESDLKSIKDFRWSADYDEADFESFLEDDVLSTRPAPRAEEESVKEKEELVDQAGKLIEWKQVLHESLADIKCEQCQCDLSRNRQLEEKIASLLSVESRQRHHGLPYTMSLGTQDDAKRASSSVHCRSLSPSKRNSASSNTAIGGAKNTLPMRKARCDSTPPRFEEEWSQQRMQGELEPSPPSADTPGRRRLGGGTERRRISAEDYHQSMRLAALPVRKHTYPFPPSPSPSTSLSRQYSYSSLHKGYSNDDASSLMASKLEQTELTNTWLLEENVQLWALLLGYAEREQQQHQHAQEMGRAVVNVTLNEYGVVQVVADAGMGFLSSDAEQNRSKSQPEDLDSLSFSSDVSCESASLHVEAIENFHQPSEIQAGGFTGQEQEAAQIQHQRLKKKDMSINLPPSLKLGFASHHPAFPSPATSTSLPPPSPIVATAISPSLLEDTGWIELTAVPFTSNLQQLRTSREGQFLLPMPVRKLLRDWAASTAPAFNPPLSLREFSAGRDEDESDDEVYQEQDLQQRQKIKIFEQWLCHTINCSDFSSLRVPPVILLPDMSSPTFSKFVELVVPLLRARWGTQAAVYARHLGSTITVRLTILESAPSHEQQQNTRRHSTNRSYRHQPQRSLDRFLSNISDQRSRGRRSPSGTIKINVSRSRSNSSSSSRSSQSSRYSFGRSSISTQKSCATQGSSFVSRGKSTKFAGDSRTPKGGSNVGSASVSPIRRGEDLQPYRYRRPPPPPPTVAAVEQQEKDLHTRVGERVTQAALLA